MLIKKDATKFPKISAETIHVPELGGEVEVRPLRASERWKFIDDCAADASNDVRVAKLMARSIFDCDGEQLASEDQWIGFGIAHHASYESLAATVIRLSGFNAGDAEKNLPTQSDASASA